MKRHTALQQLSREHHTALKLARQARLACETGHAAAIAEAARAINACFPDELEPHFRIEEKDLLPALQALGEEEAVRRTLAEHAELRALDRQLRQPDSASLMRFATLLADHVRFEERELFELAQRRLYPER